MDIKLKVLAGTHAGKEIPISGPKFLIGRAEDCHLRAGSETISRHHCAILIGETEVVVNDFNSRNGTFVNGQRVDGKHALSAGDKLEVGSLSFEVISKQGVAAKKRPAVKGISDVAARTATKPKTEAVEDEISSWIGNPIGTVSASRSSKIAAAETQMTPTDTQSVSLSDTTTIDTASATIKGIAEANSGKSKIGKNKPGKLPSSGPAQTKDSREAAANVLKMLSKRR